MQYRRTKDYKRAFQKLPEPIQQKVAKAFMLFQENPSHPSLGVKKIQGQEDIWEGRIDQFYRFTFHYEKDPASGEMICVFRNIGRHDIVDHAP